jgi:hypothetical protein
MSNFQSKLGVGLFAALAVFYLAFGALYASVQSMLWFHAGAVPEAVRPAVLPLYLGLMKLIGGASLGLGGLGLWAALGPVRRHEPNAELALAAAFALPCLIAAYVAEWLAAVTGSPTSWHIMGILLAIDAAALICVRTGRQSHMSRNAITKLG